MKKGVIAGIIVILVLATGAYFVFGKKTYNAPTTPTSPSTQNQQTNPTAQPGTPTKATTMQENVITLTNDGFTPSNLVVKTGTTVTWVNKTGDPATVNSDPHPVHTAYPPLNLGNFSDGESLTLTFSKAGTYGYHNHFNPSQRGTVVVE